MIVKLITHHIHLRYLLGFTGSFGFLFMGRKNYFFTDFRYEAIAKKLIKSGKSRIPFEYVKIDSDLKEVIKRYIEKDSIIEFEADHISVTELKKWKKLLRGYQLKPIKEKIELDRVIKNEYEIDMLRKSQKINESVFEEIRKEIKIGISEMELAWQIKMLGYKMGADDISFEPIVAFGEHSAAPHHQNTDRKLKKTDIVLIDMGMKYKGYCSDMTRTFFMNKASSEQANVYNLVLEAQEAAISKIKAGIKTKVIDNEARLKMGNLEKDFQHSLGHGIGLEVHEKPSLSQKSKEVLQKGMVVTVEPGIYLPGKFGIRIEDMGEVLSNGFDNFTKIIKNI